MDAVDPTTAAAAFDDVTALHQVAPRMFTGSVHPSWTIGGKANGGYLLSMLARAATTTGAHRDVFAASAHYLRSPDPGPVDVHAEVLRAGRSASQLRVRMLQDGGACVEALLTTGELDPQAVPYWQAGAPELRGGAMAGAMRVPPTSPAGIAAPIMGQVDLRIDTQNAGFGRGRPSGHGELWGWLALPHGADFDATSLLYAVDAFPPATFDIEMTGWVPTLELTVYVRALPAPGPVRVLQRARLIDGGRVDEECWVWDTRGRVVAHGTQLAAIRLG
jgi:acyl-coenzyme A thioesterase PaaI-like protein